MHDNLVCPSLRRLLTTDGLHRRKTAGERGQVRQVYSLVPASSLPFWARVMIGRQWSADIQSKEGHELIRFARFTPAF
jgi:hypothetical protein